ncbi:MAG: hypothetical protein EA397_09870 [Deltaproteobacteria bacterium]|nr:MAG: hypothetical protein EA397_09870 [Deltaproteobacteria bacterium]
MPRSLLLLSVSTLALVLACAGLDDPDALLERDLRSAQGADDVVDAVNRHTQSLEDQFSTPKEGGSFEKAKAELERVYQEALENSSSSTPIVDDEASRKRRALPNAIAELTGLDFVQLATVQVWRGLFGLYAITDELDTDEAGLKARDLVRRALAITGMRESRRLASLFQDHKDPSLDDQAQREAWLDLVIESRELSGMFAPPKPTKENWPRFSRCSELTGLPFEELVMAVGGSETSPDNLGGLLRAMPDLPGVDECLAQWEKEE